MAIEERDSARSLIWLGYGVTHTGGNCSGGEGNDLIQSGLLAGEGNVVSGDAGNDTIDLHLFRSQNTHVSGGTGADEISLEISAGADLDAPSVQVSGGEGADVFTITPGSGYYGMVIAEEDASYYMADITDFVPGEDRLVINTEDIWYNDIGWSYHDVWSSEFSSISVSDSENGEDTVVTLIFDNTAEKYDAADTVPTVLTERIESTQTLNIVVKGVTGLTLADIEHNHLI